MKGVLIGGKPRLMAASASCGCLLLPLTGLHVRDLVCGVAITANRRSDISGLQRLSMNSRVVRRLWPSVAGATGVRNIGSIGPALRIGATQDFVSAMATGARSRHEQAVFGQGETVD